MYGNLLIEMKRSGVRNRDIAKCIGVCLESARQKVNGKRDFTSDEMFKIQDAFFPDKDLRYLFEKKTK